MPSGFLTTPTRRLLPILPFLAPALYKPWVTQPLVVRVVGVSSQAAKTCRHKPPSPPKSKAISPKSRKFSQQKFAGDSPRPKKGPPKPKPTPQKVKVCKPGSQGSRQPKEIKWPPPRPTNLPSSPGTLGQEEKELELSRKLIVDGEVGEEGEGDEKVLQKMLVLYEGHMEKKVRGILSLLISEGRDTDSMANLWSRLDKQERRHGFRSIAGYLLKKQYLKFCARLLECSCLHNPYPPTPEDVALILEYVIHLELRRYHKLDRKKATPWLKAREQKAARLISLTLALVRVDYGGTFPVRQSTIYKLIQSACLNDVLRLYDGLQGAGVILNINTSLHFAQRLSSPSTWAKAYSIMEIVSKDRNRSMYLSQIWKMFHTFFWKATFISEEQSSAVIRLMLDCSIGPGLPSYNILMANASRNGDEGGMMQIFRQMTEAGLRPSIATYGLIHNHYKRQNTEVERSQVIRDALVLNPILNVVLATDIVHAKALASTHYLPVLEEYLHHFVHAPLVSLGIAMQEHHVIHRSDIPLVRLEPDHVTIAIMVHAFCMNVGDPMVVWTAYQRYKITLQTERSRGRLVPLQDAGCYLPNSYMLALGCHEETLWHCATIMEDMLKPGSPVQPNVYSWSILLYAMAKARKIQQAEQVLGAMRRNGIQPNVVTWTSLLTGYVRMGRLRQAGEVLRRMATDKVEPNYATMGLLASIIDDNEFKAGMMEKPVGGGERIEDLLRQEGK